MTVVTHIRDSSSTPTGSGGSVGQPGVLFISVPSGHSSLLAKRVMVKNIWFCGLDLGGEGEKREMFSLYSARAPGDFAAFPYWWDCAIAEASPELESRGFTFLVLLFIAKQVAT